jgi:hypothetical protein
MDTSLEADAAAARLVLVGFSNTVVPGSVLTTPDTGGTTTFRLRSPALVLEDNPLLYHIQAGGPPTGSTYRIYSARVIAIAP